LFFVVVVPTTYYDRLS